VSALVVCPDCFEESSIESTRCSRCGTSLGVARPVPRTEPKSPLTIGGLPFNREGLLDLKDRVVPRRTTVLGALGVVTILMVVLQLSPTTKRAPTPIHDLRATLVTDHSIAVTWNSSDRTSDGLRFFAVRISQTLGSDPTKGAALVTTVSSGVSGLLPRTTYVVSVTSIATNGRRSATDVIYVTTK
jgi:hypothetical protein